MADPIGHPPALIEPHPGVDSIEQPTGVGHRETRVTVLLRGQLLEERIDSRPGEIGLETPRLAIREPVDVDGNKEIGLGFVGDLGPILEGDGLVAVSGHDHRELVAEKITKTSRDIPGDLLFEHPELGQQGAAVLSAVAGIDHDGPDRERDHTSFDGLRLLAGDDIAETVGLIRRPGHRRRVDGDLDSSGDDRRLAAVRPRIGAQAQGQHDPGDENQRSARQQRAPKPPEPLELGQPLAPNRPPRLVVDEFEILLGDALEEPPPELSLRAHQRPSRAGKIPPSDLLEEDERSPERHTLHRTTQAFDELVEDSHRQDPTSARLCRASPGHSLPLRSRETDPLTQTRDTDVECA